MKALFDSYLTIFLHPFRIYDHFYEGIPLTGRELNPVKRLSLTEVLSVSWLIAIARAFLDLIMLNFVFTSVASYFTNNDDFFTLLGLSTSFAGYYFFLIKLVIETLLFPMLSLGWAIFWEFFLKHLGNFLAVDDAEEKARVIVSNSLTSNFIRIIPVFGDIAQGLLSTVHIYAGLKKSFGLNSKSAFIAISLPFLLICLFFAFGLVCLTLLFI
ncbi:MAG: hypothetical protein ACOYL6_10520 [Bacteriovoracaceae bacterium]